MSLFARRGQARRTVAENEVKLCALCGALNHLRNVECFTCGWRGTFERDARTIHLAWQRLYDEFHSVDIEHITGSRSFCVEDYGPSEVQAGPPWLRSIRAWWQGVMARRDARAAERERRLHVHHKAIPPNELGV
jgi:hypothetical protein